ncbi:MAG: hypothetical protein ACRD50_02530 [Candidatus Acidiferrales bacterium]
MKSVSHGGLNIMRSLGRLGVPLYNVDADRYAPTIASRYCHRNFLWDFDNRPAQESLSYLLQVGQQIGRRSILIPTTDEASMFVSEHAQALQDWFLFPIQSAALVRTLASKKEAYFLARKFGVPAPETLFPSSAAEVIDFARTVAYPVVLKGIHGGTLWKRTGKKMFIVHTERELLEKYETIEDWDDPNLMLQEYIPGGENTIWMFNGYFDAHSDCLIGFTGKKIRQAPVYTGVTSLGICLKNEIIEKTTKSFMKAIGYKGILDIGYRYDARDGQYKVLDINPRIGATFRLFVAQNGMDVARALYLHMTGQPVPSGTARDGRKWWVEDLDTLSCLRYFRDGKLGLKEWIKSFHGVEEAAFFATDDLLPFFKMLIMRVRDISVRVYDRLRRRAQRDPAAQLSPVQARFGKS